MTYSLPDGTRLDLFYHTPSEWAERTRAQMLAMGCSPEYAATAASWLEAAAPGWEPPAAPHRTYSFTPWEPRTALETEGS